jgi:hypothetical protein
MSMKNSNDTIGNRNRDLPACSAGFMTGVEIIFQGWLDHILRKTKLNTGIKFFVTTPKITFIQIFSLIFLKISGRAATLQPLWTRHPCDFSHLNSVLTASGSHPATYSVNPRTSDNRSTDPPFQNFRGITGKRFQTICMQNLEFSIQVTYLTVFLCWPVMWLSELHLRSDDNAWSDNIFYNRKNEHV